MIIEENILKVARLAHILQGVNGRRPLGLQKLKCLKALRTCTVTCAVREAFKVKSSVPSVVLTVLHVLAVRRWRFLVVVHFVHLHGMSTVE